MNAPFAYVCSPYADAPKANTIKAQQYSRRLYEMGYIPIAPHLLFPQFMNDNKPDERRDGLEMAQELLRRCRVVVMCGDEISDGMMAELGLAKRLGIVTTTLDGLQKVRECERRKPKEKTNGEW